MAKSPFPDDFAPEPTAFKGGIKRMVQIFDTLRAQNEGGYGGSVVQQIGTAKNQWQVFPDKSKATSCSPFTATVCGMLFDPNMATSGASFQPMFDNGKKPLPHDFYSMHQGNYLNNRPQLKPIFSAKRWSYCDSPNGSIQFFNLGYEIKAKDLRRGDLVGIDWSNGHGHAVFVWDVHLDSKGETDAFCFVSANGMRTASGFVGNGVSIGGCGGKPYLTGSPGSLTKGFDPLFQDRASQIKDAQWFMVPGKLEKELDRSTFKDPGCPTHVPDETYAPPPPPKGKKAALYPFHVARVGAVRLWGIRPPDRAADSAREGSAFEIANHLGYEDPPASYATGKGTAPAVHVEKAPVTVHKSDPASVKAAPAKPVKQHESRPTAPQNFVEDALRRLYAAKWIDKDPGQSTDVNDAKSKAAIEDFQTKFPYAQPVDGIAGPITRRGLRRAIDDLNAGKPGPHDPPKPKPPKIDHAAWLSNRVDPGGASFLALHGDGLDALSILTVTLLDRKSKLEATTNWPAVLVDGIGGTPIVFPSVFKEGAEITAKFDGTAAGTQIHYDHDVPIYIGKLPPPSDDWPWDERRWTNKMRDIIADLRSTPVGKGPFDHYEITQFGVKERIDPGDVEVKSDSGQVFGTVTLRSLMLADIEGTMRLAGRILNITKSGNVYEPKEVVVDGKKVMKNKPVAAKFNPDKSRWTDVTDKAPWGAGSRMPLIPFRTLAINPKLNPALYYQKVYIKQLDGMMLNDQKHNGICIVGDAGGMRQTHFDLFVGREDHHISLASVGTGDARICEIQVLGECAASRPGKR